MIAGTVNTRYELVVRLAIEDAFGHLRDVEFVLDTGFSGALTLPPAIIGALGLVWDAREILVLGNGQAEEFDVHLASVI